MLFHTYKTAAKIIVLYILIFMFLRGNGKTKDSKVDVGKYSLSLYSHTFFMNVILMFPSFSDV
jgi:hypothetical protein